MMDPKDDWETRVEQVAKAFPYPATPDIAGQLRQRRRGTSTLRVARVAAMVMLAMVVLLTVPEIRAQIIALLRIGVVDVVLTTATPPATFGDADTLPTSVLDFPGETTLEDAEQNAGYPVRLPSALPAPDKVYLIRGRQPIVVLAWLDEDGTVDVSLHLLPPLTHSLKMYEGSYVELEVNGWRALWLPDPHWSLIRVGQGDYDTKTRMVTMHALVWATPNDFTYRLETNRTMGEAQRIAESIPVGNG